MTDKNQVIAIRADGNEEIGMGHIVRCLSLAKEFRSYGCKVYFLTKFPGVIGKLKEQGFESIILHSQNELDEIINIAKQYSIKALVIDTYKVNEVYLATLTDSITTIYIDDLNNFKYPVNIVVNGNITGLYFNYEKSSINQIFMLGPKYNLIRDEFKNLPTRVINEKVKEVMITTGSTDNFNLTYKFITMLLKYNYLRLNVVIGGFFKHKDKIKDLAKQNSNIAICENPQKISEIMLRSDIAISASGSTVYELCSTGTPSMCFIMADNQESICEKMSKEGYIINLGWYDKIDENRFFHEFEALINDSELRKNMSQKGQKLVDGNGVKRVAGEIYKFIGYSQ